MSEVELTAAITRDGPWFVARCLEVEVASQGRSAEESLANLREALELYFEEEPLPQDLSRPEIQRLKIAV